MKGNVKKRPANAHVYHSWNSRSFEMRFSGIKYGSITTGGTFHVKGTILFDSKVANVSTRDSTTAIVTFLRDGTKNDAVALKFEIASECSQFVDNAKRLIDAHKALANEKDSTARLNGALAKSSRADVEREIERAAQSEADGFLSEELGPYLSKARQKIEAVKQEQHDYRTTLASACTTAIRTNELSDVEAALKAASSGRNIWGDLIKLDDKMSIIQKTRNELERLQKETQLAGQITAAIQSDNRRALQECATASRELMASNNGESSTKFAQAVRQCEGRIAEMNAEQEKCREAMRAEISRAMKSGDMDSLAASLRAITVEGKQMHGDVVRLDGDGKDKKMLQQAQSVLGQLQKEAPVANQITAAIQSDNRRALQECATASRELMASNNGESSTKFAQAVRQCEGRIAEMNAEQEKCREAMRAEISRAMKRKDLDALGASLRAATVEGKRIHGDVVKLGGDGKDKQLLQQARAPLEKLCEQWRTKERKILRAALTDAKRSSEVTAESFEQVEGACHSATRGTILHSQKVSLSADTEPLLREAEAWLKDCNVEEPAAFVAWAKALFSANRRDFLKMKPLIREAGVNTPQDLVDLFNSGDEGKAFAASLVSVLPIVKGWKLKGGVQLGQVQAPATKNSSEGDETTAVVGWLRRVTAANTEQCARIRSIVYEAGATQPGDLTRLLADKKGGGSHFIERIKEQLPLAKQWKLMKGLKSDPAQVRTGTVPSDDSDEVGASAAWLRNVATASESQVRNIRPILLEAGATQPDDLARLFEDKKEGGAEFVRRIAEALPPVKRWKFWTFVPTAAAGGSRPAPGSNDDTAPLAKWLMEKDAAALDEGDVAAMMPAILEVRWLLIPVQQFSVTHTHTHLTLIKIAHDKSDANSNI